MLRLPWLTYGVLTTLTLAACTVGRPAGPTPEALGALYVVRNGPYPLYAEYGAWLAARGTGVLASQAEPQTIEAARVARAQHRVRADDGPWLLRGCIFDVHSTTADPQESSYVWAFGQVVHCDEPIEDGVLEPQMGTRPQKLRMYDGYIGYFPMSLLEPYTGSAPAQRQ